MSEDELRELAAQGWRITRDGSTATATYSWEDPLESDSGWEVQVRSSTGHEGRFVLTLEGSGLYERSRDETAELHQVIAAALRMLDSWQGETPSDANGG